MQIFEKINGFFSTIARKMTTI